LVEAIKDNVNIIIIYTKEAHATDIWPIGMSAGALIETHKTIKYRIDVAKMLINDFTISVPVYCDLLDDSLLKELSTWPIQFFMVDTNKKIIGIGKPVNEMIEPEQILDLL